MSAVSVGSGAGITVVAGATTVAVLPNTGKLGFVNFLGEISMTVGGLIVATTVARVVAKRAYTK